MDMYYGKGASLTMAAKMQCTYPTGNKHGIFPSHKTIKHSSDITKCAKYNLHFQNTMMVYVIPMLELIRWVQVTSELKIGKLCEN